MEEPKKPRPVLPNPAERDNRTQENIREGKKAKRSYKRAKPKRDCEIGRGTVLEIVNLGIKGNSPEHISKVTSVAVQTVGHILSEFKETFKLLDKVKDYDQVRGDILKAVHLQALESLGKGTKLDDANAYQLAYVTKEMFNQMRLETDQSTTNVSKRVQLSRYTGENTDRE
jgi:hypothetical protein